MKCSQCKEDESIDGHIICADCFIDNGEKGMTTMTTNPHNQLTAAVGEIAMKIHGRFCDSKVHDCIGCVKSIRDYEHEISTNPILVAMAEQYQRMFDLVRYQRAELHQSDLITDEEYAMLCQGATGEMKGSVQRLETYDQLQTKCTELENQLNSIHRYCDSDIMYNAIDIAHIKKLSLNPTTKS